MSTGHAAALHRTVARGALVTIGPGATIGANVTIGDGATIGTNTVIAAGVTIGAGAVIAAGLVVAADVDPGAVVAYNVAPVVDQVEHAAPPEQTTTRRKR